MYVSSSSSPPLHSLPCNRCIASSKARSPDCVIYFQYPPVYLRSCRSCLRLLPHLLVTSILPANFLSLTCFSRHFLRKMWTVQLAFLRFVVWRIFFWSLTFCNVSSFFYAIRPTRLIHCSPTPYFKTFKNFMIIYVYKIEFSWNTNFSILLPDRPQHYRLSVCVTDQQYSSDPFVSLRFHSLKVRIRRFFHKNAV